MSSELGPRSHDAQTELSGIEKVQRSCVERLTVLKAKMRSQLFQQLEANLATAVSEGDARRYQRLIDSAENHLEA